MTTSEVRMAGGLTLAEYHERAARLERETYRVVRVGRGTATHAQFRGSVHCGADRRALVSQARCDLRGPVTCKPCAREVDRRVWQAEREAYEVAAGLTAADEDPTAAMWERPDVLAVLAAAREVSLHGLTDTTRRLTR